jgi:hypothetical protein
MNMNSYLWDVVCATAPDSETQHEREKRYTRMCTMWAASMNGAMMKQQQAWQRTHALSDAWQTWQHARVVYKKAACTMTMWVRRMLGKRDFPSFALSVWKRAALGLRLHAWAMRRTLRILRRGLYTRVMRHVMQRRRERNQRAKKSIKTTNQMERRVKKRKAKAEFDPPPANDTWVTLNKIFGDNAVAKTMMRQINQIKNYSTANSEFFKGRLLPFPFEMPTPWTDLVICFMLRHKHEWSGKVPLDKFIFKLFYIVNSNLGTEQVVKALIMANVSLCEMQQAQVWLSCVVPHGAPETMTVSVTRFRGKGMYPKLRMGSMGVLRVPVVVKYNDVWSVPVWINVECLPFVEQYMDTLNGILTPASQKLTALIRDLTTPAWKNSGHIMIQLAPLLAPLLKAVVTKISVIFSGFNSTSAIFAGFGRAIFARQRHWDKCWAQWRETTGRPLTTEMLTLRFLTFTAAGTEMLTSALMRYSTKLDELFLGKRHIYIGPRRDGGDLRELIFITQTNLRGVPPPRQGATLGGPGPCCIPVFFGNDDFVWVNITALPHVSPRGQWSVGIYMFVFKHSMVVMRALWRWVCRRRLMIKKKLRIKAV